MPPFNRLRVLPLALLLSLAAPAVYAQPSALPKKEISDKTSAGFSKLRPLIDNKDYPAAITLLRSLAADARPGTFDQFILSQIEAQILLTQNQLAEAVAPLERTLNLAEDNPNFADTPAKLELLGLLAQLRYQLAAESKDATNQKSGYEAALAYAERWLSLNPSGGADMRALTAALHYTLGTLGDQPDADRLAQALAQSREALLLKPVLDTQAVSLQIACHLQLGQNLVAAELLELLASRDPQNPSHWSQLQAIYLGAAADAKDPAVANRLNLRAIHVLERAQAHGHLATPKDRYTVIAILFNLQHYGRAAELLEQGLAEGGLEDTKRNWELLVSAYQQTHRLDRARATLERAIAKYPQDGALEFTFAQFLHQNGDAVAAYERAGAAYAKPGAEQPGQISLYLAYLAYELQRYEDAQAWVDRTRTTGGVPDKTLDPLARAIADALAARRALQTG